VEDSTHGDFDANPGPRHGILGVRRRVPRAAWRVIVSGARTE
jgi:hypothetical protein